MVEFTQIILPVCLFFAAFLFSSVGNAGATGYLSAMAIVGIAPNEMRPAALILNILVASIASYKYLRARCFSLNVFLPFAIASIPLSFIGGAVHLPSKGMKIAIGIVLILSAFLMLLRVRFRSEYELKKLPFPVGLFSGSIIGFLSGLTAIGGGIFLSPLLVFFKWSTIRNASGIAALFILVNSISGLLGQISKGIHVNSNIWLWSISVIIGGYIGSELGSKKLKKEAIIYFLFCVLIVAAIKMFIT